MTDTDKSELYEQIEYAVTAEYKAPNGEPAKSRIDRIMRLIEQQCNQARIEGNELAELKIRADEIGRQPASPYGRRRLQELSERIAAIQAQAKETEGE